MGRIVHFEISATDVEKAQSFYGDVFGWQFQKWDGPEAYWLIKTGEDDAPGINGGMMHKGEFPNTVNTLQVESVDDAAEQIAAHGGEIVVPKQPIPGMGYVAYFKDPNGVILGIYQHAPTASTPAPSSAEAAKV